MFSSYYSKIITFRITAHTLTIPVADGKKLAQIALSHGGNDLVGTAFSEEVYRAAGKPTNSSLLDLVQLVKKIKREPAQRDTFFNIIKTF